MSRLVLIVTVLALAVPAPAALAQQGQGDPFGPLPQTPPAETPTPTPPPSTEVQQDTDRSLLYAIGEREEVDLRALARFGWDRVLVVAPGTSRAAVSRELGSEFKGDLPFGSTGQLLVFADGAALARFADYRGRATFDGFARPIDVLPRADAVLRVRDGVVSPKRAKPG